MLKNKIKLEKPLKAVIDCGNAAACLIAPDIFRQMGIQTTALYSDVDGCLKYFLFSFRLVIL